MPQYRHRNLPSPRNLDLQVLRIKAQFPAFQCVRSTRTQRVIVGQIQPTPISDDYRVEIRFGTDLVPKVRVLEPTLTPRPGSNKLPHVYPGNYLCLYTYEDGDYQSSKHYVADTIVPWIAEWLIHYEIWHATGVWHGGGSQCLADKAPSEQEAVEHAPQIADHS